MKPSLVFIRVVSKGAVILNAMGLNNEDQPTINH
jgi:hypothetical protein